MDLSLFSPSEVLTVGLARKIAGILDCGPDAVTKDAADTADIFLSHADVGLSHCSHDWVLTLGVRSTLSTRVAFPGQTGQVVPFGASSTLDSIE